MLHGTGARSGHQDSVGGTDHQAAGGEQERTARVALERVPEQVGALDQRDVLGVLEVRLSDDPALAVGRSVGVRWVEPVEADDPVAPARQLEGSHAAHGAQPNDSDIEALHDAYILCTM